VDDRISTKYCAETVAFFCLNLLIAFFIDFNLPLTDFSHPPTAFLLRIPGRDVYFPPTANLNNHPPHWS